MVRVAGVEPAISWSQTTRLTIKPLPGYIATIVDKTLQLPFLSLERLNLRVQSYITLITNSNKFTRGSHSSSVEARPVAGAYQALNLTYLYHNFCTFGSDSRTRTYDPSGMNRMHQPTVLYRYEKQGTNKYRNQDLNLGLYHMWYCTRLFSILFWLPCIAKGRNLNLLNVP